jgi:hypothetical protein
MPNTYIYITISYTFLQEELPIITFFFAAASSHMFSSRSIVINCSGENKARKYSNLNAGFFTLKNLAVDTGHLAPRVIFDAKSEYAIHILIVLICQFLEGGWNVPSYEGITLI